MRSAPILMAAITLGLAAGYAWSAMTAPGPKTAAPQKATIMALPASPEESPVALDSEWAERAEAAEPLALAPPLAVAPQQQQAGETAEPGTN